MRNDLQFRIESLEDLLQTRASEFAPLQPKLSAEDRLVEAVNTRNQIIADAVAVTTSKNSTLVNQAVSVLRNWMVNHTIVRVIGAGRAKLAGAIPANRMAHGGARLFIVDDMIPMPHTYRAGGIVAVSASGKTKTVLDALAIARQNRKDIHIIGIADYQAEEFAKYCDIFIGIHVPERPNPLTALADTEEFVISLLLDSLVVAAGNSAGFDDTTWRLGHENLGPTGPYDIKEDKESTDLDHIEEMRDGSDMMLLPLNRIRENDFPEALLQYLWDSLDRGGSQQYNRHIEKLFATGVISRKQDSSHSKRIVIQDQEVLNNAISAGAEALSEQEADHFIGQFYRDSFQRKWENSGITAETIDDLERYVFYSTRFGKVDVVIDYLFKPDLLDAIFEAGAGRYLVPLLENLLQHTNACLGEESPSDFAELEPELSKLFYNSAVVLVSLARAHKDLNDHRQSIEYLREAEDRLDKASGVDTRPLEACLQNYLGVAYSQTGRPELCVTAYCKAVEAALEIGQPNQQDVLSLGYLAYEVKFFDSDRAIRLCEVAVEFAEILENRLSVRLSTFKNLVSKGQILSFAGEVSKSKNVFRQCQDILDELGEERVERIGHREIGRYFLNSSVPYISAQDWAEAGHRLDLAEWKFEFSRDQRRQGMASAYRSIIQFRSAQGDTRCQKQAVSGLLNAFEVHIGIQAVREAVYEGLTLLWMEGGEELTVQELTRKYDVLQEAFTADTATWSRAQVFADFWRRNYAPQLLGVSPIS